MTEKTMVSIAARPSTKVEALRRLIGRWQVTGGAVGTVRYELMEGGYFLLQHVDLEQEGQRIVGLEVIGQLQPFGEEASDDVHSRFYDNSGSTLDYVYELDGDTLRIWAGEKGSPAYFEGVFADGDREMAGAWVYPGGGGYDSVMTRMDGSREDTSGREQRRSAPKAQTGMS